MSDRTPAPLAPRAEAPAMSVRLTCEGSSDDTFGVYGAGPDDDHDNCASGEPITFRVSVGEDSLLVVGQYAPGQCGGWLIGVAPDGTDADGDDNEIPDWPMWFTRSDRAYSPKLVIETPLGVEVKHVR